MADDNIAHRLHEEMKAAELMKEQLLAIAGDDEQLITDMMEGETELRPLILKMAEKIGEDNAMILGIEEWAKKVLARKTRLQERVEGFRAIILSAMQMAAINKLESALGTLSLKTVPGKVIVTDESLIPAEYWEKQDPKLSKKLVGEALKAGTKVPGAEMSNGGITLNIRS